MPEYVPEDVKRAIRAEALERAVQLASVADNFNNNSVVVTAKVFEKYLLGEPQLGEPEPGNPRKSV